MLRSAIARAQPQRAATASRDAEPSGWSRLIEGSSADVLRAIEEIERDLAHGRVPVTDNVEALLALGFAPNRPQDPLDTTWSRAVESDDLRGGYKHQVIQLAELEAPALTPSH